MTSPQHSQPVSRKRRLSQVVLVAGCAFAILSLLGGLWIARTAIVVLAFAAVLAVSAAWDEVGEARLVGHQHLLDAEKHHQELLVETRQSATIVREVLRARNALLAESLVSTSNDLVATRNELLARNKVLADQLRTLSSMRGDLAAVRIERDELAEDVTVLMDRLEQLEGADGSDYAEVLNLPRRVRRPARYQSWRTTELPSVAAMVQADVVHPATPVWKQA